MSRAEQSGPESAVTKDQVEAVDFDNFWPSETAGDGRVVKNNDRNGAAQGKASFVRKAKCQQCGFPTDTGQNDSSGGSLDGMGAGGGITTATYSVTLKNGTVHTEKAGTQVYNAGGGCPLCFSKNYSVEGLDLSYNVNPFDSLPKSGF